MKTKTKIVLLSIGLACAIGIAFAVGPSRARCSWCFQGDCYNSSICGSGCVCLKRGLDLSGYCYGVN